MSDKLPLDWWLNKGPARDAALAKCDQHWEIERAAFDDYAKVTRLSLADGSDPAVIRTWWTTALINRNWDADPSAWAWMVSGLILRLAQSIQLDGEMPELD